jgi:hypothetical protein
MSKSNIAAPIRYRNISTGTTIAPVVSGGNLSEDSTYYYRTFLTSGTLSVSGGSLTADILLISGGGGGGPGFGSARGGGGGGAGGMKVVATTLTGSLSVLVGAGGPGNPAATGSADGASPSGGSSSISSFSTTGGGGGANGAGSAGGNGGSGGGNGGYSALAGTGISGEGNAGFQSAGTSSRVGAGGGGKTAAASGQSGGAGATSTISGTSSTYATGGDGGSASGQEAGASAAAWSGNGGNGGGGNNTVGAWGGGGGNGGSGIVVVRYAKEAITASTDIFELIGTVRLTSAQTSVTFAGLPASQYKHLQLRITPRNTGNAGGDNVAISFNADTTYTNYNSHWLTSDGTSASSGKFQSTNFPGVNISINTPDVNYSSGNYGVIIADIYDFANTSKYKTVRSISGATDSYKKQVTLGSGVWVSTAAVTSLTVKCYAGVTSQLAAGSRISLYGIRG